MYIQYIQQTHTHMYIYIYRCTCHTFWRTIAAFHFWPRSLPFLFVDLQSCKRKGSFPSAFVGRSIRVWVWSAANCEGWWNPLGRSWDASDWPAMLRWLESCWLWVHNAASCRCVFFGGRPGQGKRVDLGEEGKGFKDGFCLRFENWLLGYPSSHDPLNRAISKETSLEGLFSTSMSMEGNTLWRREELMMDNE